MIVPLFRFILLISLVFWGNYQLSAQAFPCNGRPIITLHQNAPPNYSYWIGVEAGSAQVEFQELVTFNNLFFNAVGFNRFDNYIYANQKNTNRIVRLKSDGSYEVAGEVPFVDIASTGAGDCTPEGLYAYRENVVNKLLFFEVVDNFQLVEELEMYWANTSGNIGVFNARIDDIAFDPFEPGLAYSYLRNYPGPGSAPANAQGALVSINVDLDSPEAGKVSIIGFVPEDIIRHIGALFFDTRGNLFGYGSLQGMPNLYQDRLVLIDKLTSETTFLGTGPGAAGNDGCSCPYGLRFEKAVSQDTLFCNTEDVVFTLSIESRHHENMENVKLRDTLPNGMIIQEINTSLPGFAFVAATGVGTNILAMDEVELEVGSSYEIQIIATLEQLTPGTYQNQAYLTNLPVSLGTFKSSDNQNDISIADIPTSFTVLPEAFASIQLEIIMPTNCTEANGGVSLNSSFFEADNSYLITLIDSQDSSFSVNFTPSTDSLLIITDLSPEAYSIQSITNSLQECTLFPSLNFEIPSPNHLIGLNTENNSPVCEGGGIQLSGQSDLNAQYTWFGPAGFVSDLQSPKIPSATLADSGDYTLQANYGFCQAQDTTSVEVKPAPKLELKDTITICSDSDLELKATGRLANATVFWSFPNGEVQVSSIFNLSEVSAAYSGAYFVEAINDWCKDSSEFILNVISPPQVKLQPFISFDYCEPQTLRPSIQDSTGFIDLAWTPTTGLSCSDCVFPELLSPENSIYTLTVTNEYNCADSASIEVEFNLDESIYVPNAFSPNGDNVNDIFTIYPGCGIRKIIKFLIFDKWGNEVFHAEQFDPHVSKPAWNGETRDKEQNIKVFTWLIKLEYLNGSTKILTGDVQVVR